MYSYCEVIRDLLPLYQDGACSEESRGLVEAHLKECEECRRIAEELKQSEIERSLRSERESVLAYGTRAFRRRSAAVGSAVSGAFTLPVLICLVAVLVRGPELSWVSLVMASLCVLASVTVVPIMVPEDKLFWTFCAFCASVVLLLGVACLYTHGDWFRIASGGVLFGMSVVFLPFVIRARPVQRLLGESNRLLVVLGVDFALFFNLLNAIDTRGRLTLNNVLFTVGAIAAVAVVLLAVVRSRLSKRDGEG